VVQKEGAGLPAVTTKYIDLHASQTAANLAMIYNLLGPDIAKYAAVVNPRLKQELQVRIFEPYLNYSNFFWMGFNGNAVNNWNAFNNTNCMQTALLLLKPGDTLNRISKKILSSIDYFINQYPTDGGCDEGPSYWDMAGGKLASLLINLNSASNGKISLAHQPKIHAMGSYSYKMQISGNKVVNFADAFANYTQNPNSVLAYGLLFDDEQLKNYASYIFNNLEQKFPAGDVLDFAVTVQNFQTFVKLNPVAPYPSSSLLPSLQVWAARETEGSAKGLFIAAKGGHNNESHNHNDIGNFIIYNDGLPIIIDAGVGTYTAKTFSNKRYELWNVQSKWHNTPTINGYEQKNGSNYKASDFKHDVNGATETLSMDIGKSYPKEAMVKSWKRTIDFDRKKHRISLKEDFALLKHITQPELNFISAKKPELNSGKLSWTDGVFMSFDPKVFTVVIEEKKLDDERLINIWGSSIYRIKLISITNQLIGTYQINFQSIN
jgi:Heparinase II/III-like protein